MIQGGVSSERWICLVGFVNSDESCTINARLQVEPVGVILIGFWFDCKNAKHQSEGKGKRGAAQLSQTSLLARAPLGIDHVSAENETPETNPSMNEWMKLKIKKERGKEERSAPSGRQVEDNQNVKEIRSGSIRQHGLHIHPRADFLGVPSKRRTEQKKQMKTERSCWCAAGKSAGHQRLRSALGSVRWATMWDPFSFSWRRLGAALRRRPTAPVRRRRRRRDACAAAVVAASAPRRRRVRRPSRRSARTCRRSAARGWRGRRASAGASPGGLAPTGAPPVQAKAR